MSRLTFDRLQLRGFAGLPSGTVVHLPQGLGVLCGPNELGKSSVVAGLAAVLFGLPASSDAREFGVARYRCWDGAARFEGVLDLSVGDRPWRVTRDFESHHVQVARLDDGLELEGVHNPVARRRNERYEAWLGEVLGFHSRDVFLRTFWVGQPLPAEGAVDDAVQQLLSGAAGCRAALDALADDLRARTSRTGDLGVTPRNGRVDGALERVRADLAARRERLAAEQAAADARQAAVVELAAVDEALRQAGERVRELGAERDAWVAWRRLADDWREAARQRGELQQACQEAELAWSRVRRGSTGDGGPGVSGPAVQGGEASGPSLATLGRLASLRDHAARRLAESRARAEAARRERDAYVLFERAGAPTLERLRRLDAERGRLNARIDELEAETGRAAAERAACDAEEARLRAAERALGEAAGALDERIGLAEARAVTDARLEAVRPACARRSRATAAGCLVLLGVAVALLLSMRQVAAAGAGGALGLVALAAVVWALGAATRNLAAESRRLAEALRRLGAETDLPRLLAWRRQREQLARERAALEARRTGTGPRDRRGELERALAELDALEAEAAPFAAAHGDVAAAEAAWREARTVAAAAEAEVRRLEASPWTDDEGLPADVPRETAAMTAWWADGGAARWARWEVAAEADEQRRRTEASGREALATLLAAFGEGTTLETLQARRDLAGDRVAAAYAKLDALCQAQPWLPPPAEAVERRRGLAELAAIESAVAEATAARDGLAGRRRELERACDRLGEQGRLNVAAAELELAERVAEEARLAFEVEAIALAHQHLVAATADYQATHRERLERAATRYFGPLAGEKGRRVRLDERFGIRVRLPSGREVLPEQLSRGAQDQLYVSMRLAIAELLSDRRLPLLLDDPFVTFDASRREAVARVLQAAAAERQIVVLTHDERLQAWGAPIGVHDEAAWERLPPPGA